MSRACTARNAGAQGEESWFTKRLAHGKHSIMVIPNSDAGSLPAQTTAPSGVATLVDLILKSLDDDKALDIVDVDLADKSSVTDALIIASGRSQRHVAAIADHMVRKLKEAGVKNLSIEGKDAADWVLIDAGDVVIHLFRPEVRTFYKLEKLWGLETPPAPPGAGHDPD